MLGKSFCGGSRRGVHSTRWVYRLSLVAALSLTCGDSVLQPGPVMLEELRFANTDATVGDALVVVAHVGQNIPLVEIPIEINASSGGRLSVRMGPWPDLSDSELWHAVRAAGGAAFVGFKEVNAESGVADDGQVIVSSALVDSMKTYLESLGVELTYEFDFLPAVAAKMPTDQEEVITTVRHHPNVDYLEPIFPGSYLASDPLGRPNLATTVLSGRGEVASGILPLRSGDRVTAIYMQPDGSLLDAGIVIR